MLGACHIANDVDSSLLKISNSRHIRDVLHQVETTTRNSNIRNGSFIRIHRVRAIYEFASATERKVASASVRGRLKSFVRVRTSLVVTVRYRLV